MKFAAATAEHGNVFVVIHVPRVRCIRDGFRLSVEVGAE
jgi:hypothetical protein